MKVRIKFSKEGPMKFLGHLDTMRYFQKAIRRAQLPVAFSTGFSPHMIMSFASPLGVGITSAGEYFDLELAREMTSAEIISRLNAVMAEDFQVLSARRVEDGRASNAMSLVAAADYLVRFRPGKEPCEDWKERFLAFCAQPEILIRKETKKGEKEVDIRPFLYQCELREDGGIFLSLASASANYTRPDTVMDSFLQTISDTPVPFSYTIHRMETYADLGDETVHRFVPLSELGEEIL